MLLSYADLNLILTGYTGPNQPIIGQQAASRLKMRYVNVETQIEAREGMSSEALRTRYGDARLKMVESEVMQDVLLNRGVGYLLDEIRLPIPLVSLGITSVEHAL